MLVAVFVVSKLQKYTENFLTDIFERHNMYDFYVNSKKISRNT